MDAEKFREFMDQAAGVVESLFSGVLVVGSESYAAAVGGVRRDESLSDERGGLVLEGDVNVRVSRQLMARADLPAIGSEVTVSAENGTLDLPATRCVVESIGDRPWDTRWTIVLSLA